MMTISEALAELKLIKNKIDKKKKWVLDNLTRQKHLADPLVEKGGTTKVMAQEIQAINDLNMRYVAIRSAIMESNLNTKATVLDQTFTVYQWLVWKKDIAHEMLKLSELIYMDTKRQLENSISRPQATRIDENKTILVEIESNVDYMNYSTAAAHIQEVLDKLDGILSLKNATTTISVP